MSQDFKYLAIKNWDKYQSAKANCTWVKDYVEKDFDPEFGSLTLSQKGMLDACCRLRARRGQNLANNPLWICGAVAIKAQERHNAVTAIRQLIDSGFLVLTNEQFSSLDKNRLDEIRGEKEEPKIIAEAPAKQPRKPKEVSAETSSALKAILYLPLNNGDEFGISEEDFTLWKSLYPAVDVMQQLRNMVGWCHANVKKRKTRDGIKRFITSWLSKAQDNPKAAKTYTEGGNGQPKSEQREKRNDEKYARIEQRIAGIPESLGTALPGGVGGSGNRDVDSRPKLLSLGRSAGSG